MCLYTKQIVPEIASEDIICYKYLKKDKHDHFISPHFDYKYKILGKVSRTRLQETPGEYYSINYGFHSFKYIEDVIKIITDYPNVYYTVKCIIPKGSFYYEGFNNGKINYCSDRIILVKQFSKWDIVKYIWTSIKNLPFK